MKTAIRCCALALMRVLTTIGAAVVLVASLPKIAAADAVLIYPDGGFGHTLSGPDWLRRLEPRQKCLTIFARWPRRHNPVIATLWGSEAFVWLWAAIWIPKLGVIADANWSYCLCGLFARVIRAIWPNKRYYEGVDGLMAATRRPSWVEERSKFAKIYESYAYAVRQRQPAPALHLGAQHLRSYERALSQCGAHNWQRRCNLYLRSKSGDITNQRRCSQEPDAYKPLVTYLRDRGFMVLLTGDIELADSALASFPNVVDWRRAGMARDLFQVLSGTEADLHIGNLSGGSAYTYVSDIQTVLLDAMAFGDAYPKATIQYKKLLRSNGDLVPLRELFSRFSLDFQCEGHQVVDATPAEMVAVVSDVVENGWGERPYGIAPESLGIAAPILRSADARLSPVWVSSFDAVCNHGAIAARVE